MYLAIITLPLLGSIVSGFFGRKVGVSGAQIITCTSVIVTTLLAIVAFFEVGLNNIPVSISLFRWIDSESLNVLWGFHFDSLTVSMLIPVLIVSSLVHIYSIGYMSHDPHNQRFFSYLSLFTFMMIILVTANNFLLMFVGWEGVGICSYLLVSFWFTRIAANQSSMSAFLTNRVGDCFLTIGMFAILWSFGNIDYSTVFSLAPFVNENIVTIIGICLLIGAMAKSSQVGLHVWLPMAMEGWCNRAFLKLHRMREYPILMSWSSIDIFNFGKIQEQGQSAGNLLLCFGSSFASLRSMAWHGATARDSHNNLESSETKREAFILDDKFKWWFIGFSEGDGSFILNKNGYLEFKITQSSVDAQVLFLIKKELGFGSTVIQDKVNKTHHYRVRDKNNILKIISIFNGNIVTKAKKDQFRLWLKGFNLKYNMSIKHIESSVKPSLNNSWLSGFTDAEGCFTSSVLKSSKTGNIIVTVRYILSHKNDLEFSNYVADLLNGYTTYLKSYDGYNVTVNFSRLSKIITYIEQYPLKTKKLISYHKWMKVFSLVKNKEHFNIEGLEKIKLLTKNINK